mmetsp:Transcript_24337/g.39548  ORF Transcript_24337/g.39548 Transcript_24337/m.39548 type:complete len:130 (-) Transcript_24337:542-931(-)
MLIKKKMMDIVEDKEMKRAMSTFGEKFEKVLKYTHLIQAQFMSAKIQDAGDVFKANRDYLRRAIVDLVGFSERTFGDDNKLSLPLTLKCLSLFGDDMIDRQFVNWKNTGTLNEQNNESTHAPIWSFSRR